MALLVNPFDGDDFTALNFAAADPGGDSHYVKFRIPSSVDGYVTQWFRTLDARTAPWNQRSEMNRCFWFHGARVVGERVPGTGDLSHALDIYAAQARADQLAADIEAGKHFVDTMRQLVSTARYDTDKRRVRAILQEQIDKEQVPEIAEELRAILKGMG